MFFGLIRKIVERLLESELKRAAEDRATILAKIRICADQTSEQYRLASPSLSYEDILCQIGLYRQGAANAYMFQYAYSSRAIAKKLHSAANRTLRVVAVGGGPGTELLGLTAILCGPYKKDWPKRIRFLVVDRVAAWTKVLRPVAKSVKQHFKGVAKEYEQKVPKISSSFLAMNILEKASFNSFGAVFDAADIVVFNYVLSENKDQLGAVARMVRKLKKAIPPDCLVLVIDRAEGDGALTETIQGAFDEAFGSNVGAAFSYGTINEQSVEMGEELLNALGNPRLVLSREGRPNAFWMVWAKTRE